MGVILAAGFARTRSLEEAAEIYAAAEGALRVGVFVNDEAANVMAATERLGLDVVQLHGAEDPGTVVEIGRVGASAVWKSITPKDEAELVRLTGRYSELVDGVLIDGMDWRGAAGAAGAQEGKGARTGVDLRHLCPDVDIIVAGGLGPSNIGEVVRMLEPDVVDVSSGVEESLGRKSAVLMRTFVSAARAR